MYSGIYFYFFIFINIIISVYSLFIQFIDLMRSLWRALHKVCAIFAAAAEWWQLLMYHWDRACACSNIVVDIVASLPPILSIIDAMFWDVYAIVSRRLERVACADLWSFVAAGDCCLYARWFIIDRKTFGIFIWLSRD